MIVDDLDAQLAGLAERGLTTDPVETMDNGIRTAEIRDADGNLIKFGERPADGALAGFGPAYLMKRISAYFGSGQSASGTIRSSRSATSRAASIAGITVAARTWRARARPRSRGGRRWPPRARRSSSTNSSISADDLGLEALHAGAALGVVEQRQVLRAPPGAAACARSSAAVSASMLRFVTYCSTNTS